MNQNKKPSDLKIIIVAFVAYRAEQARAQVNVLAIAQLEILFASLYIAIASFCRCCRRQQRSSRRRRRLSVSSSRVAYVRNDGNGTKEKNENKRNDEKKDREQEKKMNEESFYMLLLLLLAGSALFPKKKIKQPTISPFSLSMYVRVCQIPRSHSSLLKQFLFFFVAF